MRPEAALATTLRRDLQAALAAAEGIHGAMRRLRQHYPTAKVTICTEGAICVEAVVDGELIEVEVRTRLAEGTPANVNAFRL